ncbi:MAG: hypothetical protein KDB40_10105 [Acidimicrobiales bacterium]|nr:hypothetical protein [Acidimicrobiales bacterium]
MDRDVRLCSIARERRDDARVRWFGLVVAPLVIGTVVLVGIGLAFGVDGGVFAVTAVWVPMVCVGTASRVIPIRLPRAYHRLRPFEASGRVYELLGVRVVKRLLRRGPIAWFNPGLHLPRDPTPAAVATLEGRMCAAEASHTSLAVVAFVVAGHAVARGWWTAAGWSVAANLVMNVAPAALQRYNRILLRRRHGATPRTGVS